MGWGVGEVDNGLVVRTISSHVKFAKTELQGIPRNVLKAPSKLGAQPV